MPRSSMSSRGDCSSWRDSIGVALVGGDTTAGPLSMSGAGAGQRARRRRPSRAVVATAGDLLYVSGTPGDAAAGLAASAAAQLRRSGRRRADPQLQYLLHRFLYPEPRVELGLALRGLASACIDVSDGLAADAGKLAPPAAAAPASTWSGCRSRRRCCAAARRARSPCALTGGDDYELCFTVPPSRQPASSAAGSCQMSRDLYRQAG